MPRRTALFVVTALVACRPEPATPPAEPPATGSPIQAEPKEPAPYVFELQPHEDRRIAAYVAHPDLSSLPAMQRSTRCVSPKSRAIDDIANKPKPHPTPKPNPYHKNTKSKTASGSGSKARPQPTTPSPATPDDTSRDFTSSVELSPSSEPAPAPAAERWSDVGGDAYDYGPVANNATQPAGVRLAGGAEEGRAAKDTGGGDSSRRERRAKKKRDRNLAKSPAPESAEPAMDMEMEDDYAGPGGAYQMDPPPEYIPWPDPAEGWGGSTFLSNDDSMSLSSAQRIIYAIENFLPLPSEHVRSHELLNYFSFETAPVTGGYDFSVRAELSAEPGEDGLHGLALAVDSRPVSLQSRRNVNLTLVVDRSGSMKAEGRMEYLKRGLLAMTRELKAGDMVSLVSFDNQLCQPLTYWVMGRDDPKHLVDAVRKLRPRGSTNLNAGLQLGYALADAAYRDTYSNRVLLVTDALANTGVTDATTMSMVSDWFDSRRIRLSGIGVGREFNDHLLDKLTEKGRGAYVFLGSDAEVDAVFGPMFTSLIETIANDVHFKMTLPPSLRLQQFYGEQASTRREEVQAIHYFANTSQLFLSDVQAWRGMLRSDDQILFEVDYEHAETGQPMVEQFTFDVGEILGSRRNLDKAHMIMDWVQGLGALARLTPPQGWREAPGTWADHMGAELCQAGREHFDVKPGEQIDRADPEVQNVIRLWDKACSRYGEPRRPTRRNERQSWPGASGG